MTGSAEESETEVCCQLDGKRRPDANCIWGLCYKECSFLPAGCLCRKNKNECDLKELCTPKGVSESAQQKYICKMQPVCNDPH